MTSTKRILISILSAATAFSFVACKDKNTASTPVAPSAGVSTNTKIAYIDLDSLNNKYQYILDGKAKFENEQKVMEGELKKLEQSIQGQYAALQKKINDKTISQEEYETLGKRIQTMEQNYQQKAQALSGQLMAKTDSFQIAYRKKVDDFLIAYNADGRYDYILSYQYGSGLVLFANKTLDITSAVVEGLNKEYLSKKSSSTTTNTSDTTKK